MANGRLAKDVQHLCRNVRRLSDGQAEVVEMDDSLQFIRLDIVPNDGLYKGARLRFRVYFPEEYPGAVPQVVCLTKLYHPNIDPEDVEAAEEGCYSNICVSLLDEWEASMTLDHIVMAILFLMYNPAIDDALSPYFGCGVTWEEFEGNVYRSLRGLDVDGLNFECLIVDENDSTLAVVKDNDGSYDNSDAITPHTNSTSTSDTTSCNVVAGSCNDVNEDGLATTELLNRQNSCVFGNAKDKMLEPNSFPVIPGKGLRRGDKLTDNHFGLKFIFEFPFVRTVPANLSVTALFAGLQYCEKANTVSFETVSEVD